MKTQYKQAFSEVYEILKLMPKELISKIPTKFCNMVENERDKEYIANIKEPLEKQELKEETTIILGLIYRDFLCPVEEKKELQKKDALELKRINEEIEKEKQEKYNPNNIFKNNEIAKKEETVEELRMVEYKKPFFTRIKEWFKSKFN